MSAEGSCGQKWTGEPIELASWSDLAGALREELARIGHGGLVLVRNFDLVTADVSDTMEYLGETDRLQVVLDTGVDRDADSFFWNAEGHDYLHDQQPAGKRPEEVIYAYLVDPAPDPYLVHLHETPENFDLTEALDESHGILIYDPAKLCRMSKNEHWFTCAPSLALLAVFKLS